MWGRVTKLNGTLQGNLLKLQPLVVAARPKILLTSTALEGWTAMFDGDAWSEWFFSDSGDPVFWWRDRMGLCRE